MHSHGRLQILNLLQANKNSFSNLKQIHAQLVINGNNHSSVLAKLIQSCCGLSTQPAINHAKLILSYSNATNDVYLLNVLIRCSPSRDSILSFAKWLSKAHLVCDNRTYVFVLGSCARLSTVSALLEGKQVHARGIKDGLFLDIMVQTTAIHFYGIHREIQSARKLFDEMPLKNSVTWSAMIRGYCIQKEKVPRYARDAIKLFRAMLIDDDDEVGPPNESTMVCILSAVSQLGSLDNGICIHGYIQKTIYNPETDVFIGTGLIDMYSKCGSVDIALHIFNRMEVKNVLTWTAMMTGLAIHGKGKETLELMNLMEENNLKPNEVTFTSLLAACCHWGLVQEGLCLFESMKGRFRIKPTIQHYGCIVNLLGRAGHLKEAYEFIAGMNDKPDAVVWRSLLNACKFHGEVLMAEKVGGILLKFESEKIDVSEDYIALSNVYALADRWEDVEMVREVMKVKGVQIEPGCSSVHFFHNRC